MPTITLPTTLTNTSTADATEVMGDFNAIVTEYNSTIGGLSGTIVTTTSTATLTNKTLTTPVVASIYQDTGKTKLMTIPDTASDTLVTLAATQSLSNKTIVKPTINASIQNVTTDSDGATVTFSMATSNVHTVVLGGNRTLVVSNTSTGQAFVINLTQDGTGSRTVTWFSTIRWSGGNAPTLTTTLNKRDTFGFICTGSNTFDGYVIGQNI
jgi:hypothetical protein